MKQKIKIMYFSEDFATVGEAGYWVDGVFKKIDSIYVGATNWDVDRDNSAKRLNDWEKNLCEKYEVEK